MKDLLSYFQEASENSKLIRTKNLIYRSLTYIVAISAYAFVFYKIFSFENYTELTGKWKEVNAHQFLSLFFVFILLPTNWIVEALKWKKIVSKTENISLKTSFEAVLTGCSTGFFTPNRIGDIIGRLLFLKSTNRKIGLSYFFVNSLSQNIAILLFGIPAGVFYFRYISNLNFNETTNYFVALFIVFSIFLAMLFSLPKLVTTKPFVKYKSYIQAIEDFKKPDFISIITLSMLRTSIFCIQLFLMLQFWGVDLLIWQALLVIPTNYLFITFTPSFSFSEPAIRSSYALLLIMPILNQAPAIVLSGFFLWFINYAIPMLLGAMILVRRKKANVLDYK